MGDRKRDLRERIRSGETIICAAGCNSELEKRGFIEMDHSTPEAALDHSDAVRLLHEDFIHCGSDVVVPCNCHGLEPRTDNVGDMVYIRHFLKIARAVANKSQTLMAGSISSTGIYDLKDPSSLTRAKELLTTQIKIAVEERADFLLANMFSCLEEAKLALECIKENGNGLPSIVTLAMPTQKGTSEGLQLPEALRELEEFGADVVGLCCGAGPSIMLEELKKARKICKGPLAALPVAHRTYDAGDLTNAQLTLSSYSDIAPCNRTDIQQFAQECRAENIQFVGLCCGGSPSYIREIADINGKQNQASHFAPKLSSCSVFLPKPTPTQAKKRIYQIAQEYRKFFGPI